MVIEDFSHPKPKKKHLQISMIASPIDRLAGLVGEMPLFVPIASVFLAPFRHDIAVAQLVGSQTQVFYAVAGIVATLAMTIIVYQTLFIYFFGATPGQYFVGLKVASVFDGEKPGFIMCLLRSFAICFEILFLGFPWLAALSHPQRRVLHDRISDTYIKCLDEKKAAVAPLMVEKQLAKNFQTPAWAFALLFVVYVLGFFSSEHQQIGLVKELESKNQLCTQVTQGLSTWSSKVEPSPSRVSAALALFETGSIDEDCLEKEAQFSLWRNLEKDKGYLAFALSHTADEDIFNKYLDKVCLNKKDGEACRYTTMLLKDQVESLDMRAPASIETEDIHSEFFRFHLEKQLHSQNQIKEAMTIVDETSPSPNFADFLDLERLKIMWEMDRMPEGRAIFQTSRAHLSENSRLQFSNWMCSTEILNGCTNDGRKACAQFISDYDHLGREMPTEVLEMNYIRAQKCVSSDGLDYANVDKKLNSDRAHDYLSAIEFVGDHKYQNAKEIFKQIADEADSDELRAQANSDLVEISQSKIELDFFFEEFLSKSQSDPRFAFELLNKYLSLGDSDHVSQVGENLLKEFPYKTSLYVRLFKDAEKHKNYQFAKKIESQFKKMRPDLKFHLDESEL